MAGATTTGPGFGSGFPPCSRHDAATAAAVVAADAMRYSYWPEGKCCTFKLILCVGKSGEI